MRKTIAVALATAALAGAAVAENLNICVEGALPPFSMIDPSGEIAGFDIDIANALCAEIGATCTMVKTDWDGIIPALLEKKCDAIVASMAVTEERKQVIDFTDKYYQDGARFVAAKNANFTDSVEDMANKVVGVQRGTIHHAYLKKVYPETELVLYTTQDEAYLDLAAGRLDAILAGGAALDLGLLRSDAGEDFAFLGGLHDDPKIFGIGSGIGVRKEDAALRDRLSAAIAAIRTQGTYDEIANRYFSFDIYGS